MPPPPESPSLKVIGIIPARLASSRLPGKVLLPLAGKPLLLWVHTAARACPLIQRLIVAADSNEVFSYCQQQGWETVMTSASLASGSDRVHAVARRLDADIIINIQADEPLLQPEHFSALLRPFHSPLASSVDVSTLSVRCPADEIDNPNSVKVVAAPDGRALYFSRSAIPFDRDAARPTTCQKHLGLYAYRKAALERFSSLPPGTLEITEKLEQLRLLENGMSIFVVHVDLDTIGVDTPDDLQRAEQALLALGSRKQ